MSEDLLYEEKRRGAVLTQIIRDIETLETLVVAEMALARTRARLEQQARRRAEAFEL